MAVTRQVCPWSAAQIMRACGETEAARRELERAYELVVSLAENLVGEARTRFEAVPWNSEILAARDRDEWPEIG